jgi:hypothetical protein
MADDKNKGPLLPISGVLIILAALGVTMFTQPLKGTRPSVPELRESYKKINARLWQDPFRAVMDSVKDRKEPKGDGQFDIYGKPENRQKWESLKSLDSKIKEMKRITVLGVMVPGQPYFEETETRLRYRYAALSGLSRVGFIPDDPQHIRYVRLAPSKEITLSNIMPFEWLTHTKNRKDSILVVWVNNSVFRDDPLSKLARFAEYLKLSNKTRQNKITCKIIGPADSTTLLEMVKEKVPDGLKAHLEKIEIYSAMATIDNKLLLENSMREQSLDIKRKGEIVKWLKNLGINPRLITENKLLLKDKAAEELSENEARNIVKERFGAFGIYFKRTIGVDGRLAKKLIDELGLRGVYLREKEDEKEKAHLVLVAEWDTYYGRSFRYTFEQAMKENGGPLNEIYRRVHCISYLRGIDGSLPGEEEDKKNEKVEAKRDRSKEIRNLEQPVGKSQYDYLRRLAEETYRLDQDLQANEGGKIKAIGVVGTDFYDKFLVLQALRQRFPDVIFFTTDLDARFLHPDNIKWTRNLVVASNFNLSLRKDHEINIQGEIPPFRDNYQTSIFLTVLQAFSGTRSPDSAFNSKKVKGLINKSMKKPIQPQIFEIGRHKAILLTTLPEDTIHPREEFIGADTIKLKIESIKRKLSQIFDIGRGRATLLTNPPEDTVPPQDERAGGDIRVYIKTLIIIISAFLFLFFTSPWVNDYVKTQKIMTIIAMSGIAIIVAAIAIISSLEDEEPFSFFEGISVWPTEIFRFVAILLSALFIYLSWTDGKKNRDGISEKLEFKEEAHSLPRVDNSTKGKWVAVLNWIKKIVELDWNPRLGKEKATLNRLWIEYVQFDSDQYHFYRVMIIAFFYLLFCGLIISFDPPVSPVRGTITSWIDYCFVILNVILFVGLLSYVFDVTRCCRKFITVASNECSTELYGQPLEPIKVQIDNQLALIRLIAMRTDKVGKLIFYPFIVWLVMFVSRFEYFDNWRTPLGLSVVISMGAVYTWTCAFLLRRAAEDARTCAVGRLKDILYKTLKEEKPAPDRIKHIGFVLGEIRSINQGAFAPFTQHPVVQSLLVPFGGVGGMYLIDFFRKMNI